MAEYITTETERGNINISEEVIATMVSAAMTEVDGVSGAANTVGDEIMDLIGMRTLQKGVKVTLEETRVIVDVLIMVDYGCVVTEVAKNVQLTVTNAVNAMTSLETRVNVHVSGISLQKKAK